MKSSRTTFNMNMNLIFEVVFSNEDAFKNITTEEAKLMVCTYKPAINTKNISESIERDKALLICNNIYNMISELIITAKYIVFRNKKNSENTEITYSFNFDDIITKFNKLTKYGKTEFKLSVVSDYIEILKNSIVVYMPLKEDVVFAQKYKEIIENLDIDITKEHFTDIINKSEYLLHNYKEYAHDKQYFIELLYDTHINTMI